MTNERRLTKRNAKKKGNLGSSQLFTMSSLGRTLSSPFNSKVVQGARKFMSLQASNAQKALTSEFQELFKERTAARKRKRIVNEIIESEKSYQHHVSLLISLFLIPIKVGSILPRKVIEDIFGNIEAIHSVNVQLLELMETEDVATALYKLAPFMKLYALYANNFELSNKTLEDHVKKNSDFATFKDLQESREEMGGLKLRALLITPIQRIPRYKLLLENLLEKTTPEHPDYTKLRDACAEVSKVANHINECLRQHENFNRMLGIQKSFNGDGAPKILAPGRKFLREGTLSKVCERGGSKDRMFFLFNDMLIYAKKESSGSYLCRGVFPLINCMVEQVMGGSRGPSEGGSLFKITCKGKSLLLFSTSQHNARSWLRDIKDAISELHSNLASLRRGENDPFTPPDAAMRRDSKLRRSKGVKELSKKKNPLSPMQQFTACASPRQDSLYPMRNDILPQLAENASKESHDMVLKSSEPASIFTSCLNSAVKDKAGTGNNSRSKLRRLNLEESLVKDRSNGSSGSSGYNLRIRKRKCSDEITSVGDDDGYCGDTDGVRDRDSNSKRIDSRVSQRRLIDGDVDQFRHQSPGCFGSAKKAKYLRGAVHKKQESSADVNVEEQQQRSYVNMALSDYSLHREHEPLNFDLKADDEAGKLGIGEKRAKSESEADAASAKLVSTKVWSLSDASEDCKEKRSKRFIGKTKVSRSRRKKRNISTRRPYGKSRSKSDTDALESDHNSSLHVGTQGSFKFMETSTGVPAIPPRANADSDQTNCVVM
eukprot:gene17990-19786_t